LILLVVLCVPALLSSGTIKRVVLAASRRTRESKTIAQRVEEYSEAVHARLAPDFKRTGIGCPPREIALVGLKQERRFEVWVSGDGTSFKHLRTYPILGASGNLGPKLEEGDRQVPEGLYRIESLNPNSRFHLSLRVNYPNDFDGARGTADGRINLGGNIMIHGGRASIGCIALGDEAAEDLFVLTSETGIERIQVLLSPVDFRVRELPEETPVVPDWTKELYQEIRVTLKSLGNP
jgi:hypothetical protein